MKTYTCVLSRRTKYLGANCRPVDVAVVLIEAETEGLAVHNCRTITQYKSGAIRAERGDTRSNHRYCQELIFTPAQTDITEIVT